MDKASLLKLLTEISEAASDEWLLLFEAIELIDSLNNADSFLSLREKLYTSLAAIGKRTGEEGVGEKKVDQEKQSLISYAISRLSRK